MLRKYLILLLIVLTYTAYGALQWSPLQELETATSVSSARLAVNKNSLALLAWYDEQEQTIHSSQYHFLEKEWSGPKTVSTCDGNISLLAIHFSDRGKAALVWFDAGQNSLSLSRLDSAMGDWANPITLDFSFPVDEIQPFFDAQGNLCVVWTAWNGIENMVQGAFFSQERHSWSPVSDLSSIGLNCHNPKLAMNGHGQGIVAWQASLSKSSSATPQTFVQAVTFNRHEEQWLKPIVFGYDWIDTCLSEPDVTVDLSGNMAIIWEQMRPDRNEPCLQYVRFLARKKQWTYVSELESGTLQPLLGKNPLSTQVMWTAQEGTRKGLNIAQFDIESNLWHSVQTLAPSRKGITNIKITADHLGKLNLAWLNGSAIQVAHFDKGWTPPIHLDKNLAVKTFDIANDGIGNVLLIAIYEGELLYCTGNYLLPPDFFEGRKVEVHYATRKVNHGHLTWSHAESPNAMGYIIKRDGVVLAILPAYALQYTDYRCPSRSVCYELTTVNVDNIESLPVKRHL